MLFKSWHIIAFVVLAALIYLYSTSASAEGYHNYYYPRDSRDSWWWQWRWPLTNLDDRTGGLTYPFDDIGYYVTYPYRYFMRPRYPVRRRYW